MKKLAIGLERSGITSRFLANEILNEKRPIIYFSSHCDDLIKTTEIVRNKIIYQRDLFEDDIDINILLNSNVIFKYNIELYQLLNIENQIFKIFKVINTILLKKLSNDVVVIIDKIPQVLINNNVNYLSNLIVTLSPTTYNKINLMNNELSFNELVILDVFNSFYCYYDFNNLINSEHKSIDNRLIMKINEIKNNINTIKKYQHQDLFIYLSTPKKPLYEYKSLKLVK